MKKEYSLEIFSKSNWSLVLLKENKILYRSKLDGLKPLIACIKAHRREMQNAIVYDKIIGKAAAILLAHAGVEEIWTPTLSRSGKAYLSKNKIKVTYRDLTDCIINRKGDDVCPMEKMAGKMKEQEFINKMLE